VIDCLLLELTINLIH